MLNTSKIISFVATTKPESARKFYEHTLGLPFVSDDAFAIVFNVNGSMLRVAKVPQHTPVRHAVLGWEVADIEAEVSELTKRGVRFERYEGLSHDDRGIWLSPSGARVAWFKDTDGNTLSLTQFK